ncbi:MAG: SOS response-associated peptidase [Alphaproteobacteria bacterium]|nr:MAG: SOS response-associated peptidase [Alphaproteobacteria bacterium]
MCGRFAMTLPDDAMARLFAASPANDLPPVPRFNICPTQPIAACTRDPTGRRYRPLRWGFIPRWYRTPADGPLLINARAESIADKPAFREAVRQRRCLVPASGFYEWQKDEAGNRLPWYVTRADGAPMVFAAIWQDWSPPDAPGETIPSCAIVTTAASPDIAHIHHRMPVLIAPDQFGLWLGEQGKGAARLLGPAPEGTLQAWRVSRKVNSNRAEGPDLIEPCAD